MPDEGFGLRVCILGITVDDDTGPLGKEAFDLGHRVDVADVALAGLEEVIGEGEGGWKV